MLVKPCAWKQIGVIFNIKFINNNDDIKYILIYSLQSKFIGFF